MRPRTSSASAIPSWPASLRTTDHAYDWLQLAIAHTKLGQQEQAQEWFEKAEESINQTTKPHVELIELRDDARSVMTKHTEEQ
jgi:tetratricopeptide (TPR) repeat protein